MLIYVDEVLREVEAIQEYAEIVRKKFDAGRDAEELILDAKALDLRMDNLAAMLPEPSMAGRGPSHCGWMLHWLEKGQVASCSSDIHDICNHDLPSTAKAIREWSSRLAYVDADLRHDIAPLIRTRQFDSAIRKAFVVLKTRLCKKFGIDERTDGADLVNELFGKKSVHFPSMDPGEKAAYRDMFAGLFGLVRNRFAHNDVQPDLSDLDAAIANVNLCLRIVGDFRQKRSDMPPR
jgi:hypothetical protein